MWSVASVWWSESVCVCVCAQPCVTVSVYVWCVAPVLAFITIWYLHPSAHKGEWDRRREERWKSWLSLFIHAPPLPLYLLSFFVSSSSLLLLLLSSLDTGRIELGFLLKPSRCVVCLIVHKCVFECENLCFKVWHCVCVCVCSLCVWVNWRYLVSSGETRPISTACCSQPTQQCIDNLLELKHTHPHTHKSVRSSYLPLVNTDRVWTGVGGPTLDLKIKQNKDIRSDVKFTDVISQDKSEKKTIF